MACICDILKVHTACEAGRVHLSYSTGNNSSSHCMRLTIDCKLLKLCLLVVGNAPNSPLQTQMSSTHWNLEGSPSAAAPDYSPDSKPSHVQDAMTNGNGDAIKPAYRCTYSCQRRPWHSARTNLCGQADLDVPVVCLMHGSEMVRCIMLKHLSCIVAPAC